MMLTRFAPTALLAGLMLLASCVVNRPVAEWREDSYAGPIRDVLIIGVSAGSTTRQIFEDTFVSELAALEVAAAASSTLLEKDEQISRETVEAAIEGEKIATVLVTRLIGIEERSKESRQISQHEGDYYSYYLQSRDEAYDGSGSNYDVLLLETNVYDVASGGTLVWSMRSESVDPQSAIQVIKDQIKLVIETLRKRKLL